MKFKIFTMLVILGGLSVMPMIYMGKFDLMSFFDSSLSKGVSEFKDLKAKAPESLSNVATDKKVQVYSGVIKMALCNSVIHHRQA